MGSCLGWLSSLLWCGSSESIRATRVSDANLGLDELLRRNLLSLGERRRRNAANVDKSFVVTRFDDDVDEESEDEEGNETSVLKHGLFCNQSFETIRQRCRQKQQLFVDPHFPPGPAALYLDPSAHTDEGLQWRRPTDLCADASFLVEGFSRFDVKQGELGDCWLLAAIANLTLHPSLFKHVVPEDQSFSESYAGIFHFRFWQYGEWVDVVIDDLLPTRHGRLVYMRSETRNEFWSALLEKAYAKLHGCYEALRGGTTAEAMVDFSGGCSEHFEIAKEANTSELFNLMNKAHQRASMLACSLEPDSRIFEAKTSSGLVRGHAYSLTKMATVNMEEKMVRLVRIRNPWGNDTEWRGAWSDNSDNWKCLDDQQRSQLVCNRDDGEFYMSEEDFFTNFDTIEVCNLGPDAVQEEERDASLKWHEQSFHGSWLKGMSAGGCRNFLNSFASNPQFKVELVDADDDDDQLATCVISLFQKGTRRKKGSGRGSGCLTVGFALYRLEEDEQLPLTTDFFKYHAAAARPKAFINLRELTARFKLNPGIYVIVPSTFQPGQEGDFLLRVFTEKQTQ